MKSAQTHESEHKHNDKKTTRICVNEIVILDENEEPKILMNSDGVEIFGENGSAKISTGLFGGTILLDYLNNGIHSRLSISPDWRGFDITVSNHDDDAISLLIDLNNGEVNIESEYEKESCNEKVRTRKKLFKSAEFGSY